ncbi:hypothetical protein KFK14_15040 [Sphingobium phenoxybenzoativorans]|uniref:Sulfotransferase domain-containing protein n=1 Tax=Sphingobium phenoxybenzoativorans TaxID=1592790 RepID=A0A975Q0J3_9SPHN|nr:hypothetical protein [Sphingobium phenoxybenzoativorans]QUT04377.1 hypothetical protein KFK14_15040 [Sphingobium phenoxybenzoativorans]
MHIVIHIGGGKTGTTAIQRYLASIRNKLMPEGLLYPAAAGGSDGKGHDVFGKAFIDDLPFYMKPPANTETELHALREEIGNSPASTVLISSEQLELANPTKVREFFDAFRRPLSFKILYFVRSQDELAESEYNQLVKLRRYHGSFSDFASRHFNGNFYQIASAWRSVFGPRAVKCQVYDPNAGDAVTRLFTMAGLSLPETETPPQNRSTNSSLGFLALTAMRIAGRRGKAFPPDLAGQLIEILADDDMPALLMDAREAAHFRSRFQNSNAAFAQEFLETPVPELGGRRYSDSERDNVRAKIREFEFAGGLQMPTKA